MTTNDTNSLSDREAYQYAVSEQGYTGSYEQWQAMPASERQQYEDGAAGIGTV